MSDSLSHIDERGAARMVDVHAKPATERRAVAEAILITGEAVMRALQAGTAPKGDVIAAARLGGIMAAKRTSELIPLCHTLPLAHVAVDFEPSADRMRIVATASATAQTGVEMEALTAVTVAALILYDMLKALSHDMAITGVRLLGKTGGKSDFRRAEGERAPTAEPAPAPEKIRAAVITVSDQCSAGAARDTAGPAIAKMLQEVLSAELAWTAVLPDEATQIVAKIEELAAAQADLIVTVGGTGCSPRDVTPEATHTVITREIPGLAEAMRAHSAAFSRNAVLQRGIAGICQSSLVLNLPGSEKGATQNLAAVLHALPHAIALIKSADSRALHS